MKKKINNILILFVCTLSAPCVFIKNLTTTTTKNQREIIVVNKCVAVDTFRGTGRYVIKVSTRLHVALLFCTSNEDRENINIILLFCCCHHFVLLLFRLFADRYESNRMILH